jgi:hypothetical protein
MSLAGSLLKLKNGMRPPSIVPGLLALGLSCAGQPGPPPRYPPRSAGCDLAVFSTPVPGVPAWDDLGPVEAVCNINGTTAECLRRLRADACHMGGDIIYDLPAKPYRPADQAILFHAQVAHSRRRDPPPASASEDEGQAEDPGGQDAGRPVIPLGETEAERGGAPGPRPATAPAPAARPGSTSPEPPSPARLDLSLPAARSSRARRSTVVPAQRSDAGVAPAGGGP